MTGRYSVLKQTLAAIAGLTLLIAFVALSNIWLWFSEGAPTIPTLEGRWWAGYYYDCVTKHHPVSGDRPHERHGSRCSSARARRS